MSPDSKIRTKRIADRPEQSHHGNLLDECYAYVNTEMNISLRRSVLRDMNLMLQAKSPALVNPRAVAILLKRVPFLSEHCTRHRQDAVAAVAVAVAVDWTIEDIKTAVDA